MEKSACVHGLSFERSCIGAAGRFVLTWKFQYMKRGDKWYCLSFQLPRKSRRQASNNNFWNKSEQKYNTTCCSSSESGDKTICQGWIGHSIHSYSGKPHPRGECEGKLDCNKWTFMERSLENIIKPRQTKLQVTAWIKVETKRDRWLCCDNTSCKRKDLSGSCFMALLW